MDECIGLPAGSFFMPGNNGPCQYFCSMYQPIRFRNAAPADLPALEKLVNSAYRGEASKQGWTTEADLLDGIRTDEAALAAMLQETSAIIRTAWQDSTLAGSVYLRQQGEKLYLGMLTVSPSIQALGIGSQLLQEAERYAKEIGCTAITMTVITVREELIAWYERRGYRQTPERRPFPNDPRFGIPKQPLEFLVMEKEL